MKYIITNCVDLGDSYLFTVVSKSNTVILLMKDNTFIVVRSSGRVTNRERANVQHYVLEQLNISTV